MKNYKIITIALLLVTCLLRAQTPEEALRYSRLDYGCGSAKATSMAGSLGSLGGNFTSLSINPAGIGVYRSSDISITPSVVYTNSYSDFLGNKRNADELNFNIGNFGVVFAIPATKNGIKFFNLGIGVNRTNNFKRGIYMKGFNETNSITTQWCDEINNNGNAIIDNDGNVYINNLDPFSTELAWETYLLDAYLNDGKVLVFSDMEGGQVEQTFRMATSGSMNELVLSGGINYNDQLYLGATVGVPYFSYNELYRTIEEDTKNVNSFFTSMQYDTKLNTSATGINLKIGVIYKPVPWLRIGAALHTPTRYSMEDNYSASMTTRLDLDGSGNKTRSWENSSTYNYKLITPLRFIGSMGVIINQYGSFNIDYTFQDYSAMKFNDRDYSFDETNKMIANNYKSTHNLSIGTEWMLGIARFRAGYGFETSPYQYKDINSGGFCSRYGLGAGFVFDRLYIDFAYAYYSVRSEFYPYSRDYISPSHNKYTTNNFQLTLGLRF